MSLIYKHTFKTTGKSYIGKTSKSMQHRLDVHISLSTKNSQTHFHRAIRKYGIDDIVSTIIESNISDDKINEREIFWISTEQTFTKGYNMTIGGDGGDVTKNMSPERYAEFIERVTIANKKKIFTDEHKKKISIAKSENPTKHFGSKNGRALELLIFNNDDEVIFETNGNFKDVCDENGLPYASLNNTRYTNSEMKRGKYKGWYVRLKQYTV